MEIIIPRNRNIPYAVINMLDLAGNLGVNYDFDPQKRWTTLNAKKNYDNFLFLVKKEDLIPTEFKEISPSFENLNVILSIYKSRKFELPCFKNILEALTEANNFGGFNKDKKDLDPELFVLSERLDNIKRSNYCKIIPIDEDETNYTIYLPLWSSSSQTFELELTDNNLAIKPGAIGYEKVLTPDYDDGPQK